MREDGEKTFLVHLRRSDLKARECRERVLKRDRSETSCSWMTLLFFYSIR